MKVEPIKDVLLIQVEPLPETTAGGLYVPRTAKKPCVLGKVLATGPGRVTEYGVRVAVEAKPGDRVLVSEHHLAERAWEMPENTYLIPEQFILATVGT